jgi:hypothetical protein
MCAHANTVNVHVPIAEKQPDLVLLMGPFVDAKHPSIENGNISSTFEGLFKGEVGELPCLCVDSILRG